MAEGSMPWNAGEGGDGNTGATPFESPYYDNEWRDMFHALFASLQGDGFVLPGYLNDLEVNEAGTPAMSVVVSSGGAFIAGSYYKNTDDVTLTLSDADASNPRIDRIVLQLTAGATQTVRLAVVEGTAAATPSLPALTQTSALYEIDIAHVWVAATVTTITDEDISDKRVFSLNSSKAGFIHAPNLIINSEFIGGFSSTPNQAPARWDKVGTPTLVQSTTKLTGMVRGHAVQFTTDAANEGLSQTIKVKANTKYMVKLLINVTAGDVGVIKVTTDAASPNTITREINRTGSDLTEWVLYTTESDATELTISILGLNSGDVIKFGQILVLPGYEAGPFREIREDVELIGGFTLDADGDYDSSGLPTTYRVIELIGSGRSSAASIGGLTSLQFNGAGGTNYDNYRGGFYDPDTILNDDAFATSIIFLQGPAGDSAEASFFAPIFARIYDPANTNKHKMVSAGVSGFNYQANMNEPSNGLGGGRYISTSAISSLSCFPGAANDWKTYSSFRLYGVRK